MTATYVHMIDGQSVDSGGEPIEVINPADRSVAARVAEGTPADVDAAVQAARGAFDAWSETPISDRVEILKTGADLLKKRTDEIAATITAEMGAPTWLSQVVQVGLPAGVLESMQAFVDVLNESEEVNNSLIVREPAGVVGAITPWNFPMHQVAAKVGPALLAGCTIVVKPTEIAPGGAVALAEALADAGLPPGVLNIVHGSGHVAGAALAGHPDVDMVSFTGSVRAGKLVAAAAAPNITRVALELGGKSANVILEDADLEAAVKNGVTNVFMNSGQVCTALTRMLVPRSRLAEVEDAAKATAAGLPLGDPTAEGTWLGPLASPEAQERVVGFVDRAKGGTARLIEGGGVPEDLAGGCYFDKTIFSDVDNSTELGQEEVFGPVLAIVPYDSEDQAVALANDTRYGLSGSVWSADADRATKVARKLRTGQVSINGGSFNPVAPFGGFKESGYGRELGHHGVLEFTEIKSLQR